MVIVSAPDRRGKQSTRVQFGNRVATISVLILRRDELVPPRSVEDRQRV
jgi:hypothetical protein